MGVLLKGQLFFFFEVCCCVNQDVSFEDNVVAIRIFCSSKPSGNSLSCVLKNQWPPKRKVSSFMWLTSVLKNMLCDNIFRKKRISHLGIT